ncbi:MAG: prolyl oligopeptidase family serine peptidase [Promethearchaeia archaeon]
MSKNKKQKSQEHKEKSDSKEPKSPPKKKKKKKFKYKSQNNGRGYRFWLKFILLILGFITLGFGVYFNLSLFISLGGISDTISSAVGQISGFLIFLYLLAALLIVKTLPSIYSEFFENEKEILPKISIKLIKKIVLVVGLILAIISSLPLAMTPLSIQSAEDEFNAAYGQNWKSDIPQHIQNSFMGTQFNLLNYYLGIPQKECNVKPNIEYYSDENIYLLFDVYYPKATERELPGNNSTIIKIHGGGWTEGDKGLANMIPINKYLASQGYVVFDIQYGLYDTGEDPTLPTPEHVRANLTLHDMIFQIGYFTHQLEDNLAETYNARLDSVFIMGGSAGGHLTSIVGMGYNDPYFSGNFSTALDIKGIIPIYPANDAKRISSGSRADLIPGTPKSNPLDFEKFTPSKLADKNDPAALIYHGLQDGVVDPQESKDIENALEEKGVNCLRIEFPFAAHASDFLANNNFVQVWVFYLERFLYLQQLA